MKIANISLFVLMTLFVFGACDKPETGSKLYQNGTITDTTVVVNTPDTSYYISGFSGLVLKKYDKSTINFTTVHTDGVQRRIDLSISNDHPNLKIHLDSKIGYTPFATVANVDVRFLPAGMYPVTLTATPNRGEAKKYTVNIKIDSCSTKECNDMFMASVANTGIEVKDDNNNILEIYPKISQPENGFLYLGIMPMLYNTSQSQSYVTDNFSSVIILNINCDNGKLSIPEQTVQAIRKAPLDTLNFKVSGEGMVDLENNKYTLTYSSDSATFHLEGAFNY